MDRDLVERLRLGRRRDYQSREIKVSRPKTCGTNSPASILPMPWSLLRGSLLKVCVGGVPSPRIVTGGGTRPTVRVVYRK
jgi:hypothetical protein